MNNIAHRVLMVGLPESGKSSFIHALDEVLKNPADESDLRGSRLAHDRTYLQSDKSDFLAGKPLKRTNLQLSETSVELWFVDPVADKEGCLYIPDRKGEMFLDQWVNRRWEKQYSTALANVTGIFVFMRANQQANNDEMIGSLASSDKTNKTIIPWDMKKASAQVQLVDILQFIGGSGNVAFPLRVAVMISAWDTTGKDLRPREPEMFLTREWALLHQYLTSNSHRFLFKTYGISAYGGEPGALGDLLSKSAHERVLVAEGNSESNDLTRPLRWLLNL